MAGAGKVAWLPTLLKGRPRQRQDLCWQQRQAQAPELWLVIVDASASTRRHQALAQAQAWGRGEEKKKRPPHTTSTDGWRGGGET
ncbi:hypothetical protein WCE05_24145, partial [Pseudomonas sp. I2]